MARQKKDKPDGFVLFGPALKSLLQLPDDSAGRVMKAAANFFLSGENPGDLDLAEKIVFSLFLSDINDSLSRFRDVCDRNQRIADKRKIAQSLPLESTGAQSLPLDGNRIETETESNRIESELKKSIRAPSPPTPTPNPPSEKKPESHKYGEYGWVRLSDAEYDRLLADLGEAELQRCITYVDESAQSNGNKNKWKDWNLVVRKCHRNRWGLERTGYAKNTDSRDRIRQEKEYTGGILDAK